MCTDHEHIATVQTDNEFRYAVIETNVHLRGANFLHARRRDVIGNATKRLHEGANRIRPSSLRRLLYAFSGGGFGSGSSGPEEGVPPFDNDVPKARTILAWIKVLPTVVATFGLSGIRTGRSGG